MKNDTFVGMPNPFTNIASIEEGSKVMGFPISTPQKLPNGFDSTPYITVLNKNKMLQLTYKNTEDKRILYRVSQKLSSKTMNGDYNKYDVKDNLLLKGISIEAQGTQKGYHTAVWKEGNINKCLLSDVPLSKKDISEFLESNCSRISLHT